MRIVLRFSGHITSVFDSRTTRDWFVKPVYQAFQKFGLRRPCRRPTVLLFNADEHGFALAEFKGLYVGQGLTHVLFP